MKKKSGALWESSEYYRVAQAGSTDLTHPGMIRLEGLAKNSVRILDLGCGEGTRLSYLAKGKFGVGIDMSKRAIALARSKYVGLKFINGDIEKLPFKDGSFDLVYSAFVLEHLQNPEIVLKEAIRVTAPKGKLCFVAPNFGAPNRASPPFKGSRLVKLLAGFVSDFEPKNSNSLAWEKVTSLEGEGSYEPDRDTKVEPYLGSLIKYLKPQGLKVEYFTSCWSEELLGAKLYQRVFRILGEAGIYPFSHWGPHLVAVFSKI